MKKILLGLLPVILVLTVFDAQARYVPYKEKTVNPQSTETPSPDKYDQNSDSYITADEVESELRQDAVDKVIKMQGENRTQKEIDQVITDMEGSVEKDAEAIIDKLDSDGDELVEPEEVK